MNRIAIYLVYFLLLPCQFASAEVWDIRNEFFSANKPGSAWKLGEFLDHYPFSLKVLTLTTTLLGLGRIGQIVMGI